MNGYNKPKSDKWKLARRLNTLGSKNQRFGKEPWNKGISIQTNTGRTHFKKGYKHTQEWKNENGKRFSGEKNPKWKGGITPQHRKRFKGEWLNTRKLVLERDKYRCKVCNLNQDDSIRFYNRELSIHHIVRYFDSFNNSLENLITVCCKCHPLLDRQ